MVLCENAGNPIPHNNAARIRILVFAITRACLLAENAADCLKVGQSAASDSVNTIFPFDIGYSGSVITDLTPHWNDVWRQTSIRISGREAGIRRAGSSPRKIQSVRFPWGVLRRRIRCSTGPRRLRDAPGMRGSLRRAVLPAPVVFLGVALIAMALDHHVEFRMILDPARIAFQNRHLVGANLTCQNQNGCASAPLGVPVGCATGFSRVHGRLAQASSRYRTVGRGGVGSGAFFLEQPAVTASRMRNVIDVSFRMASSYNGCRGIPQGT